MNHSKANQGKIFLLSLKHISRVMRIFELKPCPKTTLRVRTIQTLLLLLHYK